MLVCLGVGAPSAADDGKTRVLARRRRAVDHILHTQDEAIGAAVVVAREVGSVEIVWQQRASQIEGMLGQANMTYRRSLRSSWPWRLSLRRLDRGSGSSR